MLRGFYDYIWNIVIWGKIKNISNIDTCKSSADCVAQDPTHTDAANIIDPSHNNGGQLRPGMNVFIKCIFWDSTIHCSQLYLVVIRFAFIE